MEEFGRKRRLSLCIKVWYKRFIIAQTSFQLSFQLILMVFAFFMKNIKFLKKFTEISQENLLEIVTAKKKSPLKSHISHTNLTIISKFGNLSIMYILAIYFSFMVLATSWSFMPYWLRNEFLQNRKKALVRMHRCKVLTPPFKHHSILS